LDRQTIGNEKRNSAHIAASTESEKSRAFPAARNEISAEASYVHMCTNNTIEGTRTSLPNGGTPLVADSLRISLARHRCEQYGVVFAGAQKNLGPRA